MVYSVSEFIRTNTIDFQLILANSMPFEYISGKGEIIPKQELLGKLKIYGVNLQKNKPIIVHGPLGPLLGAMLLYLGEKHVSVVIDSVNSIHNPTRSIAINNTVTFYSVAQTEYFDVESRDNDLPGNNYNQNPRLGRRQIKPPEDRRASTSCSNCSLL